MKNIRFRTIENKNPGIKIQWPKILDIHEQFCKPANFIIDETEISCDRCHRILLNFCPFCGSTKMEESKFQYTCSFCKAIFDKKFL